MLLRNIVFATSLLVGAAPAFADAPSTPAAEVSKDHAPNVRASQQADSDASQYAEREKQDPKAGDFQGGDMIVIGASGGVILVLLCLLLIL